MANAGERSGDVDHHVVIMQNHLLDSNRNGPTPRGLFELVQLDPMQRRDRKAKRTDGKSSMGQKDWIFRVAGY